MAGTRLNRVLVHIHCRKDKRFGSNVRNRRKLWVGAYRVAAAT